MMKKRLTGGRNISMCELPQPLWRLRASLAHQALDAIVVHAGRPCVIVFEDALPGGERLIELFVLLVGVREHMERNLGAVGLSRRLLVVGNRPWIVLLAVVIVLAQLVQHVV